MSSYMQREHFRVPLQVKAKVKINGGRSLEATCQNISMGGMGLSLNGEITEDTPGTVLMKYEQGGGSIEFRAQFSVAWSRTDRPDVAQKKAGIRFEALDPENRNKLAQIIINRLNELERASPEETSPQEPLC